MNIDFVEDRIDKLSQPTYQAVLELIIDAVRDYPIKDMSSIEDYLNEVRRLIGSSEVSLKNVDSYIQQSIKYQNENDVWIGTSLNSLAEALDFMNIHNIRLAEVLEEVKKLC